MLISRSLFRDSNYLSTPETKKEDEKERKLAFATRKAHLHTFNVIVSFTFSWFELFIDSRNEKSPRKLSNLSWKQHIFWSKFKIKKAQRLSKYSYIKNSTTKIKTRKSFKHGSSKPHTSQKQRIKTLFFYK